MSSLAVQNNGGYSREKFYTHATDGKGHHSTTRVEIDPSLLGQIAALIASRVVPEYRTTGDFIRDAVFHRAHEIAERLEDGRLARAVNLAAALDRVRAYEQAEHDEVGLAHSIDRCLYNNKSEYGADEVQSYVDLAQTPRGQSELRAVFQRYFG